MVVVCPFVPVVMTEFLRILEFSFSVTGPIFVILVLGVWLRRRGMLTDAFVEAGSRLVFNVALPALLFISISTLAAQPVPVLLANRHSVVPFKTLKKH